MSQKPNSNAIPPTIPPTINSKDIQVSNNLVVRGNIIQTGSGGHRCMLIDF